MTEDYDEAGHPPVGLDHPTVKVGDTGQQYDQDEETDPQYDPDDTAPLGNVVDVSDPQYDSEE